MAKQANVENLVGNLRAVNARTKAHSAELAAKQARADSEYARIKSKEVAPDFVQPGETKKLPEIILDIDRGGGPNGFAFQPQISQTSGLGDPVALNSLSPDQFRKLHSPVNPAALQQPKPDIYMDHFLRSGGGIGGLGGGGGVGSPGPPNFLNSHDPYLNWQSSHQPQPHSSTPPPSLSRISATNLNHPSQLYDPNLLISAHQLQQLHSSMDPASQKLNNESKSLTFLLTLA